MFTNKTIWQQLFNIALIVTMLIALIVIYFNVITLISGPTYTDDYDDYKVWSCGIGNEYKDPASEELTEEECQAKYDEYIEERIEWEMSEATETIISALAYILFPGIFLYLSNKYERRSDRLGVLILDIVLLSMIITGFVAMSVRVNQHIFEGSSTGNLFADLFRWFGLVLFPGIIYYILIRKSIVTNNEAR